MAISYNEVPANALVPFTYVEFDDSRNATPERQFRSLLVGQRLGTGAVQQQLPTLINGAADARRAFGRGSMLEHMAAAFRRQNPLGELWAVALDDAAAGTAKIAELEVTADSTAGGTFYLYIAGRRIPVTLSGATAKAAAAVAINAAIAAVADDLPVTTAVAAAKVTLTARHKGLTAGAEIDVRASYGTGEVLPPGLAITITGTKTAGAVDPNTEDAFSPLGDERFGVIAWPYYPDAEMDELESQLNENWSALRQLDGIGVAAFRGTVSAATTYGNARGSRWTSAMTISDSPIPGYEWAAAIAGAVAKSAEIDPALPFQTLILDGVLPPSVAQRLSFAERGTLLTDGMSTHSVDGAGRVRIERLITTEQENGAWLDVNTPLTLSYLRGDFRRRMQTKYGRFKLADDGIRVRAGQKVMTPSVGRNEAVAWFRQMESQGLVEGFEAFRDGLVVERNARDKTRLDFLLPTDVVNQLRVVGAQISFLL